jgi:hypothetical protein
MVHPQKLFYFHTIISSIVLLSFGEEKTPTKILIPIQQSKISIIPWN